MIIMALKPGDKAPQFTLKSDQGSDVSLADFRGKPVVILFFPFAFTGVCTKELCSTRDDIAFYNGTGAQVLAVSVDSHFTLAEFKKANGLNFPLLSDFNKEVAKAYGALYDDFIGYYHGVAKRSAFVVDQDGVIRYAEVLENAGDLPNFGAVQSALKELA